MHSKLDHASPPTLDQWTNALFQDPTHDKDPQSITANLSKFGLKSAKDVQNFLKTPGGEAVIKQMEEAIAALEFQKEQIINNQMQRELLIHRIRIALFASFLEKESDAYTQRREIVDGQNKEAIDKAKAGQPSTPNEKLKDPASTVSVSEYQQEIDKAMQRQKELAERKSVLVNEQKELSKKTTKLTKKYANFKQSVSEPENLNETKIQDQIDKMKKTLEKHLNYFNKPENLNASEEVHSKKIIEINILYLKLATLHQMQDVHNKQKYYADANGNEVSSLSKATFILKSDQKVIQHEGTYYLVSRDQDWDSIKDNPNAAKERFEEVKDDIIDLKELVQTNKTAEMNMHQEKIKRNQQDIANVSEQEALVQEQVVSLQKVQQLQNAQNTANSTAGVRADTNVSTNNPRSLFTHTLTPMDSTTPGFTMAAPSSNQHQPSSSQNPTTSPSTSPYSKTAAPPAYDDPKSGKPQEKKEADYTPR